VAALQRGLDAKDGRIGRDRRQAPGAHATDEPLRLAALLLGRLAAGRRLTSRARRVSAQPLTQRFGTPVPAHDHDEVGPGFEVRRSGLRHNADHGVVVDQDLGEVLARRRCFAELERHDPPIGAAANPIEAPGAAVERRPIVFSPLARRSGTWDLRRFHVSVGACHTGPSRMCWLHKRI